MSRRRKPRRPDAPCYDCAAETASPDGSNEWYMVRDRIWEAAGMPPAPDATLEAFEFTAAWQAYIDRGKRYLCIGCLERRLGRELDCEDFTAAPVNWSGNRWCSDRLADRLARPHWLQAALW